MTRLRIKLLTASVAALAAADTASAQIFRSNTGRSIAAGIGAVTGVGSPGYGGGYGYGSPYQSGFGNTAFGYGNNAFGYNSGFGYGNNAYGYNSGFGYGSPSYHQQRGMYQSSPQFVGGGWHNQGYSTYGQQVVTSPSYSQFPSTTGYAMSSDGYSTMSPMSGVVQSSGYSTFPSTGVVQSSGFNTFPSTGVVQSSGYSSFPSTGVVQSAGFTNSFPSSTGVVQSAGFTSGMPAQGMVQAGGYTNGTTGVVTANQFGVPQQMHSGVVQTGALMPQQGMSSGQTVTTQVLAPEGATVTLSGTQADRTSGVRMFTSPPLDPNKTYTYRAKATWTDQSGKSMTREKEVDVRAGQQVTIDLSQADAGNQSDQNNNNQNRSGSEDQTPAGTNRSSD